MLLLQAEFESFRAAVEAVAEGKEAELARLLESNAGLTRQLEQAQARLVRTGGIALGYIFTILSVLRTSDII